MENETASFADSLTYVENMNRPAKYATIALGWVGIGCILFTAGCGVKKLIEVVGSEVIEEIV